MRRLLHNKRNAQQIWTELDYYSLKANEFINFGKINTLNNYYAGSNSDNVYGIINIKFTSDTASSVVNGSTIITNNDNVLSVSGNNFTFNGTSQGTSGSGTIDIGFQIGQTTGSTVDNAAMWRFSDYTTKKMVYSASSQPWDFVNKYIAIGSICGNSCSAKMTQITVSYPSTSGSKTTIELYPMLNKENNCVYFVTSDYQIAKPVIKYFEWVESTTDNGMHFETDFVDPSNVRYQVLMSWYYPKVTALTHPMLSNFLDIQETISSSSTNLKAIRKTSASQQYTHTANINNYAAKGTNLLVNIRGYANASRSVYYKQVNNLSTPQNNYPFSNFLDVKNTTTGFTQIGSGTSGTLSLSASNKLTIFSGNVLDGSRFYGLKVWTGTNAADPTTLTTIETELFPAKKGSLRGLYDPITDTLYENKDASGNLYGVLKYSDGSNAYPDDYTENTNMTTEPDGTEVTTTTVYDENGNPVSETVVRHDTNGNESTQTIGYDSEGNPTVTGYTIDTSQNTSGGMESENNGIDTGFVPFDGLSKSWEMNIKAYFKQTEQPTYPGTSVNYSTAPCTLVNLMLENTPWPGIVLRYQWDVTSANRLRLISDGNGAHHTVIAQPSDNIINLRVTYSNKTITIVNKWTDTIIESYAYDFDSFNMGSTTVRVFASFDPSTNSEFRRGVGEIYEFSIIQI